MNEIQIKRKNRQVGIAECILEGMTITDTAKEYGISRETVKRDLVELFYEGYGEEERQIKKNKILALRALKEIQKRKTKKANK